jgi:allantoate deiminase
MMAAFEALADIGKTPTGGVSRPTFGEAHLRVTGRVAGWMVEAGLETQFDRWGNLFGRAPGWGAEACVMTGSHLDSVPNGGQYDGPLGVLSSLEAVRLILESGTTLQKPLEVVSFIEEEGSRFHGLFGSTLATGAIDADRLARVADADGNRYLDVLATVEFPYPVVDSDLTTRVDAFVELHIEQGKRLEQAGIPIGQVTSIAGPRWWRVELTGQADHAGATAYADRRDALLAAAEIVQAIRKIGTGEFLDTARMTVGKIHAEPNVVNIVAGKATLSIDTRAATAEARDQVGRRLTETIQAICAKHDINPQMDGMEDVLPEVIPARIQDAIARGSQKAAVASMPLVSWAAHDTMLMAHVCDAGMIFVPCRDGRSHCPEEYTKPEDIAAGVAVLANTLLELAG